MIRHDISRIVAGLQGTYVSDFDSAHSPLSHQILQRMLEHFFPDAQLLALRGAAADGCLDMALLLDGYIAFNWFGTRYGFERTTPFSPLERLLIETILIVVFDRVAPAPGVSAVRSLRLQGWTEDRCVATFLATALPFATVDDAPGHIETLAGVIEVLRRAAVTTSENRRITTGALVSVCGGKSSRVPVAVREPLRYSWPMNAFKPVVRLCDGLHTVALVDSDSTLLKIVDIHECAA